jgi:hypothetical protein
MKWVGAGIVSLVLAVSVIVLVTTLRTKVPGEEMTPAGTRNCCPQPQVTARFMGI